LRAYCATVLLTVQVYGVLYSALRAWSRYGQRAGFDFVTFWAASRLTLDGTPLKAFAWKAIIHAAQHIVPNIVGPGPWFYPPNFLLLVRPLALLPSPIAYPIFAIVTATVFLLLVRKVLPMSEALVWILAFPGLWRGAAAKRVPYRESCAWCVLSLQKRPVSQACVSACCQSSPISLPCFRLRSHALECGPHSLLLP
jgi:hypothetical protein